MEDDWGLQAVVRGYSSSSSSSSSSSASSTTNTTASSCSMDRLSSLYSFQSVNDNLCLSDLFEQTSGSCIQELHDLYKPFFPRSQQTIPICPLSVLGTLHNHSQQQQQHQKQQQLLLAQQNHIQAKPSFGGARNIMPGASTTNTATPRSKRRKNQMKKVCQVPAEDLSSDMWSWRKYGQKPIKGSPYPRGYYRCSTSKGCLARKQVERNRSDPALFIVTYTAEHNHPMPTHRNSLAGSTRQKHVTSQTSTSGDAQKPTSSPPISPATSLLPPTDKVDSREEREDMLEVEDEDDELMGVSDMGVSDDFFEGLEELAGPTSGDCFSEQFTVGLTFPWIGNSATTTAADWG